MKIYIQSSSDIYSQEYLEQLCSQYGCGSLVIEPKSSIYDLYELSSIFTDELANRNNFFNNSIGFWTLRKTRPKRNPDYISWDIHGMWNGKSVKKSSEYWYTSDGVIRGSDHWGVGIASCSWFIDGRRYSNSGVSIGNKEYAYISWSDLKAKGMIGQDSKTGEYFITGFTFEP